MSGAFVTYLKPAQQPGILPSIWVKDIDAFVAKIDTTQAGLASLLAVLVYYFIGIDEGAFSVFGKSMVVHEFVHDARHFLGFPCH